MKTNITNKKILKNKIIKGKKNSDSLQRNRK